MYYSKKLFRHPALKEDGNRSARTKLTGGIPMTIEQAIELRKVIFGSAAAPPRGEWTRTPITFVGLTAAKDDLPFGLRSARNATRGLQSVLQAFVLKYLLFDQRPHGGDQKKSVPIEQLLQPSDQQRTEALNAALAEILWTIGERSQTCIVLPGERPHIAHSPTFFSDGITEKLEIFHLSSLEDVQILLKRYLYYFTDENGPGALLFLYCAVMTRKPTKIITDLDAPKGAYLMGPSEEGSINIVTLLLTGRATPYLHNGVVYVGDEDHYAMPQFGILGRAAIGLLAVGSEAEIAMMVSSKHPGSRLKTPALPIWVTCCSNHFGVIFNSNVELLRNYHAEKRFELHYYTCAGCYLTMTVDNRTTQDDQLQHAAAVVGRVGFSGGSQSSTNSTNTNTIFASQPAKFSSATAGSLGPGGGSSMGAMGLDNPLERLIHTKWPEAKLTYHGPTPASLSY